MERTMTDPHRTPSPSPAGADPAGARGWRRLLPSRGWRVAGLAAAVAGALALGACSHGPHRGWHDGAMSGPIDPERAARFTEKMADRVVGAVDGTPEQRQRIAAIAQAALTDLAPMREKARDGRRRGLELLRAPTVDRTAIEALRVEQVALADAASKRVTQALADSAEVLTPEQRARLADRMQQRMQGRGRWS
jgi:Spy/CpxP family protein refolding chaperone